MTRLSSPFRTDISDYAPSPGDLAYPEKLEMMESIAESLQQQQQQQQQQQALSRQHSGGAGTASEAQIGHRRQSSTSSMASLEVAAINGGAMMTKNMNASSKHPNYRIVSVTGSEVTACILLRFTRRPPRNVVPSCPSNTSLPFQVISLPRARDLPRIVSGSSHRLHGFPRQGRSANRGAKDCNGRTTF